MDCNKGEATRAKDIAEKKMLTKDFVGAKKLLIKASQLYPEIENASHMLTVCDVHCSAGSLVNGQIDHYGILQVEMTADEALIRKQYRRLALLLHPDKNKFAGAEAAFKLVGEAYKVLSDQVNRQVYDSKRRVLVRTAASWKPSQNARNARSYTAATINVSNKPVGIKPQDQQPHFFSTQFFWTMCIFCNNRFQYSRSWLNRDVMCQKCFKKFIALEVSPQNVPPPGSSSGFAWNCTTALHENAVPVQRPYSNPTNVSQSTKPEHATMKGHEFGYKEEKSAPCGDDIPDRQKAENIKSKKKPSVNTSSSNARLMRSRKVSVNSSDSESAESDSTDSISEVDPKVPEGEETNSRYPRRSVRSKINITYKEESEDEDFASHPIKIKIIGSTDFENQNMPSSQATENGVKMKSTAIPIYEHLFHKDNLPSGRAQEGDLRPDSKETVSKNAASYANSKLSRKPRAVSSFSYPDSEFYNFDSDRLPNKFAVNQLWAVYDEHDGMPRYYAKILKVYATSFRLQYIWLEINPTSTAEKAWVNSGLPIACGSFSPGRTCITKSLQMFSHLVLLEEVKNDRYNIYPKKGEVWALFKNWDIQWNSNFMNGTRKYTYEFVVVVSDFEYGKDVIVSYLVKVRGFRYVFAPVHGEVNTVIPSSQLLKFSHCIPFHRIIEEKEGIPIDSRELDPAALSESCAKVTDPLYGDKVEDLADNKGLIYNEKVFKEDLKMTKNHASGNSVEQVKKQRRMDLNASDSESIGHNHRDLQNLGEEVIEDNEDSSSNSESQPNSEFCNFEDARSEENFSYGQIWALYSDVVEYPNFYAWIKKVGWEETGSVSIKWLEHAPVTPDEKLWSKNGLPFACGRFKVVSGTDLFETTDSFSHLVSTKMIKKNDLYEVYPNVGEIWAVYKNWNLSWTSQNINQIADYFVVEIVGRNDRAIKAVPLTKVKGYNYVFMRETKGMPVIELSLVDCLRFSHQIPALRLTTQESGMLNGYWELDRDSIPKILLTSSS